MNWLMISGIIVILLATVAFLKFGRKTDGADIEYPYQKAERFLTAAERSFFGVLNQAVGGDNQIFAKVRVADVIDIKKGISNSQRQRAFNRISKKHFDFVLCRNDDLSVVCAIELNDNSHQRADRQKRDAFLESACNASGIRLIPVPAKAAYTLDDVRRMLGYEPNITVSADQNVVQTIIQEMPVEKKCPKCSSLMVRRVSKRGEHAGKQFWACSAYPKCRYLEAIG